MKKLFEHPVMLVVIGDAFVSPDIMVQAAENSSVPIVRTEKLFWGTQDKEQYTSNQLKVEREGPDAVPYAQGLDEVIEEAEIIMTHFCPLPEKLIKKAKKLKAILTCRGGMEHICVQAASEKNIPVINVIRNAEPVADFALGMVLSLTRGIAASHHAMKKGIWQKQFFNSGFLTTLNNHTVGLAGIGNIGAAFGRRLKALGVPMIAYDAYTSKETLEKEGLGEIELVGSLEDLFRQADIVSIHLRLTPETEKIIDYQVFSKMKPTSYFINTARGGLINQPDLVKALKEGKLAGAALDVYESEPLSPDDPLLQLDNVLLTPHIAGTTVDAVPKSPFMLMDEVDRMINNGTVGRIFNYKDIAL